MMSRYFAPGEENPAGTPTPVVKAEIGAEEKHEPTIPYERFAEVNQQKAAAEKRAADAQAQLDKIAQDKKTADEKALAEQGKWKDLADAKDKDIAVMKQQLQNATITNAIVMAAQAAGAVDPAAVVALLDKSKLTVGADGIVVGVKEAVQSLLKEKTYLVGQTGSGYHMGAGGGGGGDEGGEKKHRLVDALQEAIHG
jgi:hypothetical protein